MCDYYVSNADKGLNAGQLATLHTLLGDTLEPALPAFGLVHSRLRHQVLTGKLRKHLRKESTSTKVNKGLTLQEPG